MLAIRLPASVEKRLAKLARRTGRTKTYYAREAILQHLDDLEDVYLAERLLDRIRRGEERTIPLESDRLRMLRTFDEVVPRIPSRDVREVERELRAVRQARRSGGRRSARRRIP